MKFNSWSRRSLWWPETADYRCADVRFLKSPRGMAVFNTKCLSSSEKRFDAGIKGYGNGTYLNQLDARNLLVVSVSHSAAPDIFKPLLKCSIFKCISWLNGLFFGGEHRGFLKEGVKTYRMAPMSSLNSTTFFFVCASIVYARDNSKPQLSLPEKAFCITILARTSIERLRYVSKYGAAIYKHLNPTRSVIHSWKENRLQKYRCSGAQFLLSARDVTILNCLSVYRSETEVRNGTLKKKLKKKKKLKSTRTFISWTTGNC